MKERREYVAVLAFLAAIIGISGCSRQKEEKLTKYDTQFFELFDTVTSVTGYARDEKTFQSYVDVFYDRKVKALQPYMDSVLRIYLSSMVLLPGKDCYQGLLRDPYGA